MKNTEYGLSLTLDSQDKSTTLIEALSQLLIGAAIVFGIWGMGRDFLSPAVPAAALVVFTFALLVNYTKKWHGYVTAATGILILLLGLMFREAIASGLGSMGNVLAKKLTAQTGYYFHNFATHGQTIECALAVGIILGVVTAVLIRIRNSIPALVCSISVFAGCCFGIFQTDLYLALYLIGILLILAKNASGIGKTVFWTAGMVTVLGGCVILIFSLLGIQPDRSEKLEDAIHEWRYEDGSNPLPEGNIASAGIFRPSDNAALEITMEQWEGVYLRGFVGSRYTGSGWEEDDPAILAESADLLYTLQKDYFHPSAQLAAAGEALETDPVNQISVKILGACKAYSYLPYGISGVSLDCRDLSSTQAGSYTGIMYAVDEAYLLQKELSDGAGTQSYLDAEAAYRQWVYAQYLDIPEQTAQLLGQYLGNSESALTTTQAKEQVLAWLDETLTYDEYATTRAATTDLAKYLVDVSPYGYSFHYATLGTLALRYLGIPARYVEGYMIPKSVASSMGAGETLTLSHEYAHAWVEYYLDGIGWIPFEVTPGFENELVYQLPPDGTGAQDQEYIQETQPPATDEPPIKQEPDSGSQTRIHMTKIVQNVLLALLIAAIIAFLIRMFLLRTKLKRRIDRFRAENSREAMLDCLRYQAELLETMGLRKRNAAIMKHEHDICALIPGVEVKPILQLAQELSFSHHSISEDQHQQVLNALSKLMEIWKQKTPLHKRLQMKWIRCKVL